MTATPALSRPVHAHRTLPGGHRPTVERAAPAPPVVRHRVPTVLLAGVSHAGGTGFTAALGLHPQVCLPGARRIDHFTPLRYGQRVESPLEDYDRHFAAWSGQRHRLETSPVYFDGGPRLVAEVAAALPGARVVLLLRDPTVRLWASYTDKVRRGRLPEPMSFDRFVDRCLALRDNGSDRFEGNRYYRTLSSGAYVEHLPAWVTAFGDRLRVVFAEHVEEQPQEQRDAVLRWLGLDPAELATPQEGAVVAAAAPSRSPLGAVGRLWPLGRRASAPGGGEPCDRLEQWHALPRQGEQQRARVRDLYAQANHELAAYLRRRGHVQLPGWLLDA